ncbi:MAG: SDR family NAD(P)-dependent oxidoreductase, partial [Proteobacteria bacterium]|nr:SDR family NAD(P)-dependent oxidoreductase [Pseudomonadota bacterium]
GHDLVLVARTEGPLQALGAELSARHGVQAVVLAMDLSGRVAADTLVCKLERRQIVPELLINSAGIGAFGLHRAIPLAAEQELLDLNIVTLTRLTKRLLPALLARGSGRILNVASVAAFQPGPYMAVYYASKAYVLHYSEALAHELEGSGVSVTALCPGPTPSGFQARAGMQLGRTLRRGVPMMGVAQVARRGYRALLRGQRVVVPGVLNALLARTVRFVPRRWATAAVALLSRPR